MIASCVSPWFAGVAAERPCASSARSRSRNPSKKELLCRVCAVRGTKRFFRSRPFVKKGLSPRRRCSFVKKLHSLQKKNNAFCRWPDWSNSQREFFCDADVFRYVMRNCVRACSARCGEIKKIFSSLRGLRRGIGAVRAYSSRRSRAMRARRACCGQCPA